MKCCSHKLTLKDLNHREEYCLQAQIVLPLQGKHSARSSLKCVTTLWQHRYENTFPHITSLHRIMSCRLQGRDVSSSCRSLPQMQIPATAQSRHICEKLLQVCVLVACTPTRWRVLLMTNNTAATKDHPDEMSSIICHITIARGFEIEGGRGKKHPGGVILSWVCTWWQ